MTSLDPRDRTLMRGRRVLLRHWPERGLTEIDGTGMLAHDDGTGPDGALTLTHEGMTYWFNALNRVGRNHTMATYVGKDTAHEEPERPSH